MDQLIPNTIKIIEIREHHLIISLAITNNLSCFSGHFPNSPLVPGVAQIHWAEHFARQLFGSALPAENNFNRLEAIKFKNVILPQQNISLHLKYCKNTNKLYFTFENDEQVFSSGRIGYAV
jgi:3-hydroxymyristoyl/3-hydroxydecanoyl-(acyl carrier protein) dehydratase